MNLKQKLAVLAGIPIIGMLVLAGLGYLDLSQQSNLTSDLISNQFVPLVERDIAELNKYQASVKTLLEADRDAYQSLVAEMSILQAAAGSDTSKSQKAHQENMQQVKDRVGKASKAFDDAMMAEYKVFQNQFEQWKTLTNQTVAMAGSEETKAQAMEQSSGVTAKAFGDMRDTLDGITQLLDEKIAVIMGDVKTKKDTAVKMGKDGQSQAETAIFIFALITLIVAVLSIALTIVLTISITRPIRMVANGLDQGAHQLASASNEVSNSSQMLAEGTSEQAASLEQTSSSMEEMASMTKLNASNASQADSMMHEAAQTVAEAVSAMEKLRTAMDKINSASDETAKIIKTIDEIAFQTNLLALNAAVEAARAGEAGAGFAVVADEVRSLAMRAAEAARNTSTLIEQNINDIKIGTNLVRDTDEVFVKVQEVAVKVAELVGEISAASSEQSQGIDQVNLAMGQMDGVTQQIAANAEEAAAASEELRAQSVSLQGYVVQLDKVLGKRHNESTPSPAAIKSKGKAAAGASTPEPKSAKMPEAKPLPAPETLDDGSSDFEDF